MYLEIDEGFPKHRKTLRLRSIMRDPRAGWYMVDLWTWACRSCPDGDLTGISSYEIEEAANYQLCDGKLCKAMIDAGFIDSDDDGNPTGLHNWMKRTGAAIARMAKRASDMKALRDQRKKERDGTVTARSGNGNTYVDGQTSPDKTSPDPDREEISPPAGARDPGTEEPEDVPPAPPAGPTTRMTGQDLVRRFGEIRHQVFPETLPWHTARDARGDAGTFASMLRSQGFTTEEVEGTMRKALEHIRDGVAGWNKEQHAKNPSFAFGAWVSGFHGLLEERRGRSPPVAVGREKQREKSAEILANWRPKDERESQ